MSNKTRVAIYGRVSTDLGEQDPEQQLIALRKAAEMRGWEVVWDGADMTTGDSELWERERGRDLWTAIKTGKVDTVMTWDMSRLSREHPSCVFALLDRMEKKYRVHYTSYTESFFDTTNEDMRPLIVGIIAWANNYFLKQLRRSTVRGKLASKARGVPQGRHGTRCGLDYPCPTGAHERGTGKSLRAINARTRRNGGWPEALPQASPPTKKRTATAASPHAETEA